MREERSAVRWTAGLFASGCLVACVAGCHSVPGPVPLEQLNAQQRQGHAYFQAHCGVCHYDRVDGPLHGPSLRGVLRKPYLPSGAPANDDRIAATVLHGRNLMAAQPDTDPQDLQDLLAYLRTL